MDKILLYGASLHGEKIYNFLKKQKIDEIVYAFVDGDIKKQEKLFHNKKVIKYDEAKLLKLPFVISVSKEGPIFQEIKDFLINEDVIFYDDIFDYEVKVLNYDRVNVNRDWCAYYHINCMDSYFDRAESIENLEKFWNKESPFYKMFSKLDLSNIIELACGRGRHVQRYCRNAKNITLVDILPKNIKSCQERYSDLKNISYLVNNGYDLHELPAEQYTALFTYDAMVHFELIDIYNYLKDIHRVLKKGGMALFHHSNDSSDYRNSFYTNEYGRSFMDKNIFAYLATHCGFDIVHQQTIDWGLPDHDCITLVRKV